jgi:hypothetical protein
MKRAVFFFTALASMAVMIRTSDALAPQPVPTRVQLALTSQHNLQHVTLSAGMQTSYVDSVSNQRQSPMERAHQVALTPAGVLSSAQMVRMESPQSSSLDLLLMVLVLMGFIGVQLRRAQDHLQRPFVSP